MERQTATIDRIIDINENRKQDLDQLLTHTARHGVGLKEIIDKKEHIQGRIDREHPSLRRFVLDVDETPDFEPGQFITVFYDQEDRDRPLPRSYSIANSPNDDQLELCVRLVEDGEFTPELFDMEPGDELEYSGPNGHFTLEEDMEKDPVFIATGTGIAPLKSMIDYSMEEELIEDDTDMWLFYGARWEDDLAYRDEFEALDQQYDNFHFVPTLSKEFGWNGEDEYVQDVVDSYIEDGELDPDQIEPYICGLQPMIEGAVDMLDENGVEDYHFESYGC